MSWWQKLFKTNTEIVSQERMERISKSGVKLIKDWKLKEQVEIKGLLISVKINPAQGTPWLEAIVDDGSGQVKLIWMGRRTIAGIVPGKEIRAWGRLVEESEKLCIYNPKYELSNI